MFIKVIIPNINEVVPYTFDEKQSEFKIFEPIIQKLLESVPSVKNPQFVHMLGIPGAGKTTFYQNNISKFQNFLKIDFDTLMDLLFECHISVLLSRYFYRFFLYI